MNNYVKTVEDRHMFDFLLSLVKRFPTSYSRILFAGQKPRKRVFVKLYSSFAVSEREFFILCKCALAWIDKKIPKCLNDKMFEYSLSTKLNWIFSGRRNFSKCENSRCSNSIGLRRNIDVFGKYNSHCSCSCSSSDPDVIIKQKAKSLELHGNSTYRNQDLKRRTCFDRYGEESFSKTKTFKEFIRLNAASRKEKEIETKRLRHTLNSSSVQDRCLRFLIEKFGDENIQCEYRCERYPFYCDFYIKPLDLFVELNAHWTHGGMKFDKNDAQCVSKLKIWKKKAKVSQYFKNAILTWTVRDVRKRKYAGDNQLKYLEFWSENDFFKYFK